MPGLRHCHRDLLERNPTGLPNIVRTERNVKPVSEKPDGVLSGGWTCVHPFGAQKSWGKKNPDNKGLDIHTGTSDN